MQQRHRAARPPPCLPFAARSLAYSEMACASTSPPPVSQVPTPNHTPTAARPCARAPARRRPAHLRVGLASPIISSSMMHTLSDRMEKTQSRCIRSWCCSNSSCSTAQRSAAQRGAQARPTHLCAAGAGQVRRCKLKQAGARKSERANSAGASTQSRRICEPAVPGAPLALTTAKRRVPSRSSSISCLHASKLELRGVVRVCGGGGGEG